MFKSVSNFVRKGLPFGNSITVGNPLSPFAGGILITLCPNIDVGLFKEPSLRINVGGGKFASFSESCLWMEELWLDELCSWCLEKSGPFARECLDWFNFPTGVIRRLRGRDIVLFTWAQSKFFANLISGFSIEVTSSRGGKMSEGFISIHTSCSLDELLSS